jgi:6-phosphogluconolactonase
MASLHVLNDPKDVAHAAAAFVVDLSEKETRASGRFTVALAGGSSPRMLYELLATSPYADWIARDGWQVFWGDERPVPPDNRDSNYRMVRESLLDQVPVPAHRVQRIRGEAPSQIAAKEYEDELREVFDGPVPAFDLILLGLGEDGHTASLFPGSRALDEKSRLVVAPWVSHLGTYRITFTLPLINASKTVLFLVTDESKAPVLRQVMGPGPGDPRLPASLVRPTPGVAHWFLTRASVGRLQGTEA